ncbi:MAG: Fic family protein [Paludibacteraceae bacterium]|nr:Fic family protein [Paludibacteraceae bacterium]
MEYISVKQFAEKTGVPERTIRNYCATGKIEGAFLIGKTWNIPADANLPKKGNIGVKDYPLLTTLKRELQNRVKGGIYHKTQIELTYNSNHIEGSRLTKEQTRYIFETHTIGATTETLRVDDIIETVNHFRCIDYIIEHSSDKLSEPYIKRLHAMLKENTADSQKDWFAVGDYKRLPNEVGGIETTLPEDVHKEMNTLILQYNSIKQKSLDNILDFHVKLEKIHPFQDGNGRVGRLIMFKECLANGIVPFIITEELKMYYYRGLQEWNRVKGYLTDTCLTAQDQYKLSLDYFRVKY